MPIRRLICILSIFLLYCSVASAVLDPFDYLQYHYDYEQVILNPHPEYGDIVGADGFNNGNDFAILWSNGNVGFFHEGETTPYKVISTPGNSGISEVPADIYSGDVAVTDANGIFFYDQDGNLKGGFSITASDIVDITYDSQRARLIILTTNKIYSTVDGSSLTALSDSVSLHSVEYLDLESNPSTFDMLQTEGFFDKLSVDGNLIGSSYVTDLGTGSFVHGLAYTDNSLITTIGLAYYVYPKLEFQDHLETEPYNPQITITSPENNKINLENNTEVFQYLVESNYDIANCTIIINDTVTEGLPIEKDTTNSFPVFLENNSYQWHIECRDASGRLGESEPRNLTVSVQHTSLQEGLVGYWSFDEGTGTTAYDYSGNDNHGTIHEATYLDGVLGKALSFDGLDDYVNVADTPEFHFGSSDFSICAWVQTIDDSEQWIVDHVSDLEPWTGYALRVWGVAGGIFQDKDGDRLRLTGGSNLADGIWHHLSIIRQGSQGFLFVDGVLEDALENQLLDDIDVDNALTFSLNRPAVPCHLKGSIDEVRIYNRALSESEIQMLYNNPDAPDLIEDVYNGGQFFDDNIISGSAAEFAGVVDPNMTVTLFIDGQPKEPHFTSSGNWSITAGSLSEGYHQAAIRLMNTAGDESDTSDSLSFIVDLTKPVISDMQVQPSDCQPAGQIFTIRANATDACSDLWESQGMDCDIRYSDQSLIESINLTHQGSGLFSGTWDSTGHDSGSYPIDFTVWDIAGNPKYEIRGTSLCVDSPTAYCGDSEHPYPTGDFDKDCYVDINDLLLMASNWLDPVCAQNDDCLIVDLNDDNEIDLEDLAVLGSTWLSCTDPYPPCNYTP